MDPMMDNYRLLARYNTWFNACLFDACERLDDAARKAPRGAFFGSIHATLNHLLWGDAMWLGRFAAQGEASDTLPADLLALPAGARYETELHADWAALCAHRVRLDADSAACGPDASGAPPTSGGPSLPPHGARQGTQPRGDGGTLATSTASSASRSRRRARPPRTGRD